MHFSWLLLLLFCFSVNSRSKVVDVSVLQLVYLIVCGFAPEYLLFSALKRYHAIRPGT